MVPTSCVEVANRWKKGGKKVEKMATFTPFYHLFATGGKQVVNRWKTGGKQVENRWKTGGKQVVNRWKICTVPMFQTGGKQVVNRWKTGGKQVVNRW
jgi:hypothetical protein